MSSAEVEEVTAMKRRRSMSAAPPLPRSAMAVAGDERPAPFWAAERGRGYVGNEGEDVRAAQPSPMIVANPNGIPSLTASTSGSTYKYILMKAPYQAMPPKRYALIEVSGRDAIARCQ